MAKKKNNKLQPVGTYASKISGVTGNSNKVGTYRQNIQNNLNAYMSRIREEQERQAEEQQRAKTKAWQDAYRDAKYSPEGDKSWQVYAAKMMADTPGAIEKEQQRVSAANMAKTQEWKKAAQQARYSPDGQDRSYQVYAAKMINDSSKNPAADLNKFLSGLEENKRKNQAEKLVTGTAEMPGWLGAIPEETQKMFRGKTANQILADAEKLRQEGYWDSGDDMSMWSGGKRTSQRKAWNTEAENYQKQIDELQKQIDANNAEDRDVSIDRLVSLYTSPEVKNELAIINRPTATAAEKENARKTLNKLYASEGLSGNSAYANALNFANANSEALNQYLGDREGMRRSAYDAMNGTGAYDRNTQGMTAGQKKMLDQEIDNALIDVLDPNGKPGIDLRTAKMQLENTQDKIKQLDELENTEAKYNKLMAGRDYADTEYHPENNIYTRIAQDEEYADNYRSRPADEIYAVLGEGNLDVNIDITNNKYGKAALMSDEKNADGYSERDIFLSYYNAGLYDEAEEFYRGLEQTALNQRYSKFEKMKLEVQASRIPVTTSIASIAATPLQTVEYLANLPDRVKALLFGEENGATDENSGSYAVTRFKNIIRNKIAGNLGDAGWVYQGFMSGADSALNVAIGKGIGLTGNELQYGTLALFGTQAFETSLQNKMESGSNNFAYDWVESWVDAAIETATEIWSVENLMSDPTNIIQYIGKLAISEPSEEVAGAIFAPYIQEMIGHKNEWKERARQILGAGGYTDNNGNWVEVKYADQATRQAMRW